MRAYALVMVTMFLFAGNYIVGKVAADAVPPLTLTWLRTLIGVILVTTFYWKKIRMVKRQLIDGWRPLVGMAATGIVMFPAFSYLALHYTTTINASIMESLTPAVTIFIGAVFLKEKYGLSQLIGVGISLTGVAYIISKGSFARLLSLEFNSGDLIMIGAVISWAVYSTLVNIYGYRLPLFGSLFGILVIGNVMVMIAAFLFEWSQGRFITDWSMPIITSILYTGLFPSFLALLSWNMAVAEIGPAKATIFINLLPFATAILSLLFLQEKITVDQVIGGAIVLTGIYFTTRVKGGRKPGYKPR